MAKILIHLATGPENPSRAALALLVAKTAVSEGHDVQVFLAADAVQLARPETAGAVQGVGTGSFAEHWDALTADTPRFTFGIIEIAAGRELEQHVHDDEDDAFFITEGEMTFLFGDESVAAPPGTFVLVPPGVEHGFRNDGDVPVRMFNIHAPAG